MTDDQALEENHSGEHANWKGSQNYLVIGRQTDRKAA
jgi:hypothetical protein